MKVFGAASRFSNFAHAPDAGGDKRTLPTAVRVCVACIVSTFVVTICVRAASKAGALSCANRSMRLEKRNLLLYFAA
eukprot:3169008-Pleurochrysis_carterae.AAC.1